MRIFFKCLCLCSIFFIASIALGSLQVTELAAAEGDIPPEVLKKLQEEMKKKGIDITINAGDEGASSRSVTNGANPFANALDMRWRVYTNQEAGIAFRFPYFYRILDQYGAKFMRHYGRYGGRADMEMKTALIADIAQKAGGTDIKQLATYMSQGLGLDTSTLTFKDYDYYSDGKTRPHAGSKWAPEGVTAVRGNGENMSAIFVVYQGRISGLVSDGASSYYDNEAIFDTLEVMNREKKNRKRSKGALMTWRESIGKKKTLFMRDAAGRERKVKPNKKGPAPWKQCWELETSHYHITSHVSSQRLYYYGMLCEALWKEFYNVYQPDTLIPYKMEIHIFNEFEDFNRSAASVNSPISFGVGGFFHPMLLCIFAYEKSTDVNASFTPSKVLAHELSHQFLHTSCNGSRHVPTWINEGLAVYFETFDFKGGKYKGKAPTGRIKQLVRVYNQTKDVLWDMDMYIKHYGHIPALNYAEVYAMTHFWIFGDPQGKKRFQKYWKALKAGENGTEAFERIFMVDLIKAQGSREKALKAWTEAMKVYVTKKLSKLK